MIIALLVLPSEAQHHANHHQQTETTERFTDVPDNFKTMLTEAVEAYIAGKDAFLDSNLETATSEFENFIEKLEEIGEHGLDGEGHMAWMESYNGLMKHASALTASADIDDARKDFHHLSEELITAVNKFGIDGIVYQQFCPMALDSGGANWLSKNDEVQNPYKPETMLGCGEVIEKI